MGRSQNAQLAVDMFDAICTEKSLDKSSAWKAIAQLLLSCHTQSGPKGCKVWANDFNSVIYREANDFYIGSQGPNKHLRMSYLLSDFLASEIGISRKELPSEIGLFLRHPYVSSMQQNNLVGHAFRSMTVRALEQFGDCRFHYEEEVDPYDLFLSGFASSRGEKPKIDIVALNNGGRPEALISCKWRYRHDRSGDLIDEARNFIHEARRLNPNCRFYGFTGEFDLKRLKKFLDVSAPPPTNPLSHTVHFAPVLIDQGLGLERPRHLKSLEWLIDDTFRWA